MYQGTFQVPCPELVRGRVGPPGRQQTPTESFQRHSGKAYRSVSDTYRIRIGYLPVSGVRIVSGVYLRTPVPIRRDGDTQMLNALIDPLHWLTPEVGLALLIALGTAWLICLAYGDRAHNEAEKLPTYQSGKTISKRRSPTHRGAGLQGYSMVSVELLDGGHLGDVFRRRANTITRLGADSSRLG
jgi:hypothetical protein